MTFVEGLNGIEGLAKGSFALIVKVHHAAVDGVSGAEMIWALLEANPLQNQPHKTQAWQPESIPSKLSLLARTAGKTLEQFLNLAKFTGQTVVSTIQLIKEKSFYHTPLPPLPLTAPTTPLNGPITARRTFRAIVLPLHRIRAMRRIVTGVTVNDVVLAICAGALRRYLRAEQTLPDKPLVAAVPISVRSPKRWQDMGNRVSAILVSLATDESDPSKRLQLIHDSVSHAKRYGQAIDLEQLSALVPALTTVLLSRLYSWISPVQWPGPFFNLFITNVPGPQQPFYLGGARLAYHLGMAPIFDGLGLILVITSYLDTLVISATSCPEIMPDPERLIRYLQESFAELDG
jgi:WS/DGAT/MGAT family acyltransferase